MRLGSLSIQWVSYIPEWKDNREAPEEDRLSLEIQRLRPVDELADISDEEIAAWRDAKLKDYMRDDAARERLQKTDLDLLRIYYRMAQVTRNWKNFEFQNAAGEWIHEIDTLKILLHFPTPTGENIRGTLMVELFAALRSISQATEDELKNFLTLYGGTILD
tara:strand:+ start:1140 stop:1625 length:486 start_codon:yes stop_codon:yes gene_type:complete